MMDFILVEQILLERKTCRMSGILGLKFMEREQQFGIQYLCLEMENIKQRHQTEVIFMFQIVMEIFGRR